MKVCYVPSYNADYSRVKILKKGLEQNGVEVIDCSSNTKSLLRYLAVFLKFLLNKSKCDIIFVGFFGQPLMPFVKIFTRKKIVFDAFMSAYNTMVEDKNIIKRDSFKARLLFWLDRYSCQIADIVLLDTYEHIKYFCKTFRLEMNKFRCIPIGADEAYFYPKRRRATKEFKVEFHGNFVPLQGTKYIIKAAKLIKREDIKLVMIGEGQMFNSCLKLAKDIGADNIEFTGKKNLKEVSGFIANADIGLGLFGDTEKARLVMSNKAYEILAMKKALITADTAASRELFKDKINVILCKSASGKALADAIIELKNNPQLRKKIAANGYRLFREKYTSKKLGLKLKIILEETISKP